ncbi:ATP-dependent transcriptional regulator, MalT- like, LuxR family [Dethiosulfovibrio peptidovorans DSM 11002]|uniref:ATP-dependent transcriptional regulator, MalT-like, LuxR family n=1 Tax=Dethiosulfovibrio peptidovorans DSM 11002 TaxID=469381 RepID=D2Z7C8_9BACT|nr:LuxR C-terminal-related transcriptional regulator [Dethiosulfovibrio peptidovorans]EFC91375.1 ATP-dependent transcriptional regulator, MalT- like, LuxR family [Dethiosulfovibrio peptidovorans DSM 11002]
MKNVQENYRPQVHYYSNRLKDKLRKIRDFRTTFIEAPSGAGKTTAIRDFFNCPNMNPPSIRWFVASEEPGTSGWTRFCHVLGEIDPYVGSRLLHLGFPVEDNQGEVAQALVDLVCDDETYLICDNFQFVHKNLPLSVWRALVDHGGYGLRVVIITQQLSSRGLAILGNANVLRVENEDLCLTEEEIGDYYCLAGVDLDLDQRRRLYLYSEGWIAALYLQLVGYARTGSLEGRSSIHELVNELLWKGLSLEDRQVLFRLSPFDSFTVPQLSFLLGLDRVPDVLVERLGGWLFVRYDIESRRYFLHAILLDFVRSAIRDEPEAFQRGILAAAGEWCASQGDKTQALFFLYRICDYRGIFSLDLHCYDMTRATLDAGREYMLKFLRDTVNNSTVEMRCDYAFNFISMAFEAFNLGDVELYVGLCREMEAVLDGYDIDEESRRSLRGELYLARSFGFYNDIEAMGKDHSRAYELLGPNSRLFKPDTPWTFGWPSVLGMFHSGAGELDRELSDMDRWLPLYNSLTSGNGSGAELIFRAEALLHKGRDDEAEPLVLRALEITKRLNQDSLYLCAAFLLQRMALLRGDGPVFTEGRAMRDRCARMSSYALSNRITDVATGFVSCLLGDTEGMPSRVCSEGFLTGASPAVPFSCMVYGRLALLTGGERDLVLRSEELLFPARRYRNLLVEIYMGIYLSVAYSRLGRESDGAEALGRALDMAMPDGLILPFAENADVLGSSLDVVMEERWSSERNRFSSFVKRYSLGKERVLQSLSGREAVEGLTFRENDVALLVSEGLSNREIAKRLFLSENTVKFYLKSIFQKLGISSRRDVKKILSLR